MKVYLSPTLGIPNAIRVHVIFCNYSREGNTEQISMHSTNADILCQNVMDASKTMYNIFMTYCENANLFYAQHSFVDIIEDGT